EGLQHQDGHSHLFASAFPTVRSYDPAYAYETAVIVMDGLRRMYEDLEDCMYYITLHNENYLMPAMPEGIEEGIVQGIYQVASVDAGSKRPRVQLFGSGAILREALRAQKILAEKYQVSSTAWSVTSYTQLSRDARAAERWNLLHPGEKPRQAYIQQVLAGHDEPVIASSDNVRAVAEQVAPWIPGGLTALGTDGLGRSDLRSRLRRHFEVDAETIVLAALDRLADQGQIEQKTVVRAIGELEIDPDKIDPMKA
ncbi:MAG: pyruvate dehydrogenase (acetyl-transferring), homodimeric type, partial [Pirellulales bacterium]